MLHWNKMYTYGMEKYKCNWENAELRSWLAGPLPLPSYPGGKKKNHFSWNPSPEALMGVMSVMGGGGGGGEVGAQWPSDGEGNRSIWGCKQKQAPAIH